MQCKFIIYFLYLALLSRRWSPYNVLGVCFLAASRPPSVHRLTSSIHTSSSRSHLVVGSLRQTQFSSSQFCHGLHLSLFRWLSCLGWHSPHISASVFLAFFSQVVPSPESFFLRSLGLASLLGQTTSIHTVLRLYLLIYIIELGKYTLKTIT